MSSLIALTGATGKVGNAVTRRLLARGDRVRVLVRNARAASAWLPEDVEVVEGDVTDAAACRRLVANADAVFTCHGLFEQWLADTSRFAAVNATGAANVANAARDAGVRRMVHTSTYDVFDTDDRGNLHEELLATSPKATPYERSKQQAERLVLAAADKDFEVVIVNPGMVYGPGPFAATGLDASLRDCLAGRLPGLPRGAGAGLVYVDAVAEGHLAALEQGRPGERYILSGPFVELRELCRIAVEHAGTGRVPAALPRSLTRGLSATTEAVARLSGRPPMLPAGQLKFLLWGARPVSDKAARELGFAVPDLTDGIHRTVDWMLAYNKEMA